MKAFSTWQPHATLLAAALKPYETRTWHAPASVIGTRVAIHAAKAVADLNEIGAYIRAWNVNSIEHDPRMHAYVQALSQLGYKKLSDLPTGCIIATAVLDASIPTAHLTNPGLFGDFTPGRVAWSMRDPRLLAQPIPFVGKQGFFNVPDDLLQHYDTTEPIAA